MVVLFLVFKTQHSGYWYLSRTTFSNMNIFSSVLPLETMMARTSGGADCDSDGDYLRSWRRQTVCHEYHSV